RMLGATSDKEYLPLVDEQTDRANWDGHPSHARSRDSLQVRDKYLQERQHHRIQLLSFPIGTQHSILTRSGTSPEKLHDGPGSLLALLHRYVEVCSSSEQALCSVRKEYTSFLQSSKRRIEIDIRPKRQKHNI